MSTPIKSQPKKAFSFHVKECKNKEALKTFKTLLREFGQTDLKTCLSHTDSFERLLAYGAAYIEGYVYRQVWSHVPFGSPESDCDGHELVREDLSRMHQYRCFTYNGQISRVVNHPKPQDVTYPVLCKTWQKSFVSFCCERRLADALVYALQSDKRVRFIACYPEDSCSVEKIVRTAHTGLNPVTQFVWTDGSVSNYTQLDADCTHKEYVQSQSTPFVPSWCEQNDPVGNHPNYNNLFRSLVFMTVMVATFGQIPESTSICLYHLKRIYS